MTEATIESVRDLPLWWQVTRYDPARRDADGAYPDDDWVERADIGRTFGGEVLTEATYLRVEESYLTSGRRCSKCAEADKFDRA